MAELAAAETRRSVTREKKNQQELQTRFDDELHARITAAERRYRDRVAGLQAKHAEEIAALEQRWKHRLAVVDEAALTLKSPLAQQSVAAARARILEHATTATVASVRWKGKAGIGS